MLTYNFLFCKRYAFCFAGIGHEAEQSLDINRLPDAIPRGVFKPVQLPTGEDPTFIMFDLETTDLSKLFAAYI